MEVVLACNHDTIRVISIVSVPPWSCSINVMRKPSDQPTRSLLEPQVGYIKTLQNPTLRLTHTRARIHVTIHLTDRVNQNTNKMTHSIVSSEHTASVHNLASQG